MKTYAEIENNVVINLIVSTDSHVATLSAHLVEVTTENTDALHAAVVGAEYNREKNKFISPKPFPSWTLNEDSLEWNAPLQKPLDGIYAWIENDLEWLKLEIVNIDL
jgi:hypothetical protein